jgi:hypothetical protein
MSRPRPASASAAAAAAAAHAGAAAQWWHEARRGSQAAGAAPQDLVLRPSRSAASSLIPEGVLKAVAARASVGRGARAPGADGAPRPRAGDDAGSAGAKPQPPPAPPPPRPRRSMAAGALPPPAREGAYVKDREVGAAARARSSEKAGLLGYLRARAGTAGRVMGEEPPAGAGGDGGGSGGGADGGGGAAADSSGAGAEVGGAPRAGVFVWEEEPPALGLQQAERPPSSGARPASPFASNAAGPRQRQELTARPSRTPSPGQRSGAASRPSLAAAAATAAAAAGRASPPLRPGGPAATLHDGTAGARGLLLDRGRASSATADAPDAMDPLRSAAAAKHDEGALLQPWGLEGHAESAQTTEPRDVPPAGRGGGRQASPGSGGGSGSGSDTGSDSSGSHSRRVDTLLDVVSTGRYEPRAAAARRRGQGAAPGGGARAAAFAAARGDATSSDDDSDSERLRARVQRQRAGSARQSSVTPVGGRRSAARRSLSQLHGASSDDSSGTSGSSARECRPRPRAQSASHARLHQAGQGLERRRSSARAPAAAALRLRLRRSLRERDLPAVGPPRRTASTARSSGGGSGGGAHDGPSAARAVRQTSAGAAARGLAQGRRASLAGRPAGRGRRDSDAGPSAKPLLLPAQTGAVHMRGALQRLQARRRASALLAADRQPGARSTRGVAVAAPRPGDGSGSDNDSSGSGGGSGSGSGSESEDGTAGASPPSWQQAGRAALPKPACGSVPRQHPRGGAARETYETLFRRLGSSGDSALVTLPSAAARPAAGQPRQGSGPGGGGQRSAEAPAVATPPRRALSGQQQQGGLGCSGSGGSGGGSSSSEGGMNNEAGRRARRGPAARGDAARPERDASAWAHGILRRLSAAGEGAMRVAEGPAAGAPFGYGSAGTYSGGRARGGVAGERRGPGRRRSSGGGSGGGSSGGNGGGGSDSSASDELLEGLGRARGRGGRGRGP